MFSYSIISKLSNRIHSLWKVQKSINEINQTYEIDANLDIWNYRAHFLLDELRSQVELFACSAGIWTQTTDVEGEVNGMLTYDRRIVRPHLDQWNEDIQALYDAAAERGGRKFTISNHSMSIMLPRAANLEGL